MGLDMFLYKKIYINGQYAENKDDVIAVYKGNGSRRRVIRFKIKDVKAIESEAICWRKNYAINEWMLDKIGNTGEDNCVYMYVDKNILTELRDILRSISWAKTKKEKLKIAQNYLATDDLEEDFDDYLEDFERTLKELNKIIDAADFNDAEFYYYIWY